jgi:hypothetical protein
MAQDSPHHFALATEWSTRYASCPAGCGAGPRARLPAPRPAPPGARGESSASVSHTQVQPSINSPYTKRVNFRKQNAPTEAGGADSNLARGLPRRRQLGRRAPPPLLGGARPHERDALAAAGRVLAGGAFTCKPSALTRAACVQIGGCACARAEARSQQRRTWVPGTAASSPRARGGRCGTLRGARPEAHRRRRGR